MENLFGPRVATRNRLDGWRTLLGRVLEGARNVEGRCGDWDVRESKRREPVVSERALRMGCYTGQLAFWKGNRVIGSPASQKRTYKLAAA